MDAIALLKKDHDKVKKLLNELEHDRAWRQDTVGAVRDDQGRTDNPRDHRGRNLLPGAEGASQGEGHRPRGSRSTTSSTS